MSEMIEYKGLISSCLQKSIRRGRNDLAQEYLNFLWTHDRNYITFRFGTILSEDVGIANHELVSQYLTTRLAKKNIEEAGGFDFLSQITAKACDSIKDRSSCDSAYLASYFNSQLNSKEDAIKIFKDQEAHYINRINAGWAVLGGKKFKSENINFFTENNQDNITEYIELVKEITTPLVGSIVEDSYYTQRENIGLGTSIVENIYQKELLETHKIKPGKVIENMYVKEETFFHKETGLECISCGLDGHTREGANIYYQYLKNSNFSKYLNQFKIDYKNHMLLLKHCLFRVEGHEVNKRIYFPTAVNIMRDCEEQILNMKAGFSENVLDFKVLKNILLEDIHKINQMRADSFNNNNNKTTFYKKSP